MVLAIAGLDPSGGAGILADCRTIEALGGIAQGVVTAVTAQSSLGVVGVYPVPVDQLAEQVRVICADRKPDAVKIGMLGNAEGAACVAELLAELGLENVVFDPVLRSTSGASLFEATADRRPPTTESGMPRGALFAPKLRPLLALCSVVTPNLSEVQVMTGSLPVNVKEMVEAGNTLLEMGAKAALIKGGHLEGEPVDVLVEPAGTTVLNGQRIPTGHTHGTGCFLSSALAVGLAQGIPLVEAAKMAKAALQKALETPIVTGQGPGYPRLVGGQRLARRSHSTAVGLPKAVGEDESAVGGLHGTRLGKIRGIYVITDDELRPDRSHEEICAAALAGGATVVQFRSKKLAADAQIGVVRRLVEICHALGAVLIVNDRVDVTLAAEADGVHLGPGDMLPQDARPVLGPDRLIGVSVANVEEARKAAPWASYFGVGAIYGSRTKGDAGEAVGPGRIAEIRAAFPQMPIVAIGGIDLAGVRAVAQAGAACAAVISAVVCEDDMQTAVRQLQGAFRRYSAP